MRVASMLVWAVLGSLGGCSPRAEHPAAVQSTAPPPSPPARQGGEVGCGAGIAGQDLLTQPIVLLGETHGTTEIPAAFGRLVCHAAMQRPSSMVLVGLEVSSSEQAAIDSFLDSDGGPAARHALLEQESWQREYQDGRSSKARLDLLDDLRRFRASGLRIVVRAIDAASSDSSADRDARMAAALVEAVETLRPAQTLVLIGDVHSRILNGYPWDPSAAFVPMGAHLRAKYGELVGLNVTSSGGSAWMCLSGDAAGCGVHELPAREVAGETPRITLTPGALDRTGWSGTLFIGPVTPSAPARLQGEANDPGR